MPDSFPPTVAEREAELIALQSAFDEYIASSRELEEELDAELAKMQEKLAESAAANAALSAQLENIAPQLTALEQALTDSRMKLKEEQKLRRLAEQGQDEAENRIREFEQSLIQVREECDVLHEELAFKENELEETKLELDVEKQQLQNELRASQNMVHELQQLQKQQQPQNVHTTSVQSTPNPTTTTTTPTPVIIPATGTTTTTTAESVPSGDDGYVKKLEEELELVTEQLIETEKRLSEAESTLLTQTNQLQILQNGSRRMDDEVLISRLQTEAADQLETEQKLREDIVLLREELGLSKEECTLQQEEIQALEEDRKALSLELEEARVRHRDEMNKLSIELKEAEVSTKNSLGSAAMVVSSVKQASEENERLHEQIAGLELALQNAKEDYKSVIDELDAVNSRFDEARNDAELIGRQAALEELRAEMKSDAEHEIKQVREQLVKLSEENKELQRKVDHAEMALATARDSNNSSSSNLGGNTNPDGNTETSSEVVKQLQAQLTRAREDIAMKEAELSALSSAMEDRLGKAEENITQLEGQLRTSKGQLAEAEAHLIILRRDKERLDTAFPGTPKRVVTKSGPSGTGTGIEGSTGRGRQPFNIDRQELSQMDDEPSMEQAQGVSHKQNRSRSTSPSSVMRLQYRLVEETRKVENLQKEYEALQNQRRISEVRIKRLEDDLRVLQKQLFSNSGDTAVVTQMTRLSSLASTDKGMDIMNENEIAGKRVDKIIASQDLKQMSEELKSLEKKCNSQREYNAQLLSKMLHLQGNIQVFCRIRPMTISELQKGWRSVVEGLNETEVGCFDSRTNKWKSFVFDRVWGHDQSQQSVFQDVEPLALSVVDGFNACIFAYGQTGSGKTFTMEGVADNNQYGISYRTIQKVFHLLKLRAQQQRAAEMFVGEGNADGPAAEVTFEFSIQVGMLEIYNDEIYDLLGTEGASMAEKKEAAARAGGKASLDIRRDADGRIEVPNLTKEKVETIDEVMALLKRGNANRATASTDMNEHSSRSHMVLIVDILSGLGGTQSNKGNLFLVDLAGSERVRKSNVEGEQLKEAGFINKSLSALGNVMEALDRKASHVPYRDSKLTYLLQDSLGGNSRTMMIVTIDPTEASHDESVHALQFATRVRRIQIGAAQRNVTSKNLEETVKRLTDEMRALTRAKERTESQLHSLKRDNARVQDKLQNLNKSKTQNRSDSKTLDVLRKNNDEMAARWQKERTAREEAADELEKTRKELRTLQQQLAMANSKLKGVEQRLEEKETEIQIAGEQLRLQKNDQSAATVRARREQVLSARKRHPAAGPTTTTSSMNVPASRTPVDDQHVEVKHSLSSADASSTGGGEPSGESVSSVSNEVKEIRGKVLALLEKYDKAKVDRVDIIMEKFKGKEALLLEKMTQRYESSSMSLESPSAASSAQKRNELALQRHQERMKRIREKGGGGTTSSAK